jgi:hypothetical protein
MSTKAESKYDRESDPVLSRLKRLPRRLRIAHLAALLRCEAKGARRAELTRLLTAQSAAFSAHMNGGRTG